MMAVLLLKRVLVLTMQRQETTTALPMQVLALSQPVQIERQLVRERVEVLRRVRLPERGHGRHALRRTVSVAAPPMVALALTARLEAGS
jgi:hypothetical protein